MNTTDRIVRHDDMGSDWAICDADGSVSDRFASQAEAVANLVQYPAGHTVQHVPDPGIL